MTHPIQSIPFNATSLVELLSAFVILFVAFKLIQACYRIYFHPLSKFPGPKLAAASKWWEFCLDTFYKGGGQFYFELQKLHDRYGPIVRIAPNELHVRDSTWSKALYGSPGTVRNKPDWLALTFGSDRGTFSTINHEVHKMRRKPLQPYFSRRAILDRESEFNILLEELSASLERKCFQIIDLRVALLAYATDVTSFMITGRSIGLLSNDAKAQAWSDGTNTFSNAYPLIKQCLWIAPLPRKFRVLSRLLSYFGEGAAELQTQYWDLRAQAIAAAERFFKQPISKKGNSDQPSKSLFNAILYSDLPPDEKSVERLIHEGFELTAAGSGTTARILSNALYHILANDDCKARVCGELDQVMPDPSCIPSLSTLEGLPYLTAVIKETLRISALITTSIPRIALEPLHYGQWSIPPKTIIGMCFSDVLMDENAFPDAHQFRPERWLVSDEARLKFMGECFVPFGRGPRQCLGINLAYSQIYRVLATLLTRFDLKLHDTIRERDVDHNFTWFNGEPSRESKGIRVQIVSRTRAWSGRDNLDMSAHGRRYQRPEISALASDITSIPLKLLL